MRRKSCGTSNDSIIANNTIRNYTTNNYVFATTKLYLQNKSQTNLYEEDYHVFLIEIINCCTCIKCYKVPIGKSIDSTQN